MKKQIAVTFLFAATLFVSAADAITNKNSRTSPFILGAEVSWTQEDEADGAEYFDHGVKKDIFDILADRKINFIRLRLFVNPGATNGYAAKKSEAFCDLAHVKTLATRAKAHGMGLLLDIHYGDTWTSPGHQDKPGAWRELSFGELTNKVHDYTREIVTALRDNGTQPDMVQVGNEISDGVLFPDGSRSKPENFAALVGAGCRAVREVDPKIKIVLHHHLGRDNARMRAWIDNFLKHGVDFDLIGMSCYAQAQEGDWQRNFDDLATRYPNHGLLVVEYSGRKRFINELMFHTPNAKGWGTFIWEATRHREAIFDHEGANAGGGQAANFKSQETNAPAATNVVAVVAKVEPENHGGRYDVNALADLYPPMAKDFVGIAPPHKILPPLAPAPTNVAPNILTPPAPAEPQAEPSPQTYTLHSVRGGWTAIINPDGSIGNLAMTFGGKRIDVPWCKSDGSSGPAWKLAVAQKAAGKGLVSLKKTDGDGLVFEGRSGEQVYSLAYRDEAGDLTLEAGIRNDSDKPFVAAPEVRLVLGIDHEMNDPKNYFTMFFPSLLRCERTHFWGYFETPNGQVLAIASKDPVASWALGYIGNGHRIATTHLDVLHATPLPARHPQDQTALPPRTSRSWRISLRAVNDLDEVMPAVAAMSGAPGIALTRTTVAPGETLEVALYSTGKAAAEVTAVDEQGQAVPIGPAKNNDGVRLYQFPAPQTPGLITIRAMAGGKQCEAVVYVRKPWGWYLQAARTEALRMQQKASSHREGWLGFFSAYWAQMYFPDAARLAETDQKFKEFEALMVDPATGHFYKGKTTWADRPQNSSWMLGLLVARYAATQKPEDLEQAAKWADLFIAKFQKADGAYSHGKNSYGALTLGSEFLSHLVSFERPLAGADARWKERFDRHTVSIARSVANLEKVKDLGATEGDQTYEDNQAGSAWSLLALHALMADDRAERETFLAGSVEVQKRHECLTQALIPDGRMRGGTLRWWEAQYDVLTKGPNMMNSPHGWTMRSQFGALYLYLLTGQERYLDVAFNAMGACAQAIDLKSGTLRWAFVSDPYVKVGQFVPDPEKPGEGKYVSTIIGEQWLPMISDWWQVPPGQVAAIRKPGWSCDNDVHEHFRIMGEEFVPNAFVVERADGTLRAWNCQADRKRGVILVKPAEAAVARVHFNLHNASQVEVQFASETIRAKLKPGMKWVLPKAPQPAAPAIYLRNP